MQTVDVLYILSDIFQGKTGRKLTLPNFNRYLPMANAELKRTLWGKSGEQSGYETDLNISDALLPFKTFSNITVTNGYGTLPTNFWHKISMYTDTDVEVEFVTNKERRRRDNCSIDTPSLTQPIVEIISATQFQVRPITITPVRLYYLKEDTPKLWAHRNDSVNEYSHIDPITHESTPLLWSDDKYIDIIRIMLGYLNIPLTPDVVSYVEQKVNADN